MSGFSGTACTGRVRGGLAPLTLPALSNPLSTTAESEGSFTPISSSACLSWMRSSRDTSSFAVVRVFSTMRMTMASAEIDSSPQSSGFSRMRERHFGLVASAVAVASIFSCTASMSVS